MFGIGSRTYYAIWHDILFNFEYIRDRNYFVDNIKDAKLISAKEAYDSGKVCSCVKVYASSALGRNTERKERINNWYDNKRCNFQ